jgi:hypothetical protein
MQFLASPSFGTGRNRVRPHQSQDFIQQALTLYWIEHLRRPKRSGANKQFDGGSLSETTGRLRNKDTILKDGPKCLKRRLHFRILWK